jgi:outer membrane receptor protein involved in Fe transport
MDTLTQRTGANRLAAAISAVLAAVSVQAAQPANEIAEITVTATRRAEDIQDIPLNIAAISGAQLKQQGITDLANLGRAVPGLYVIDQGKRTSNQIIVRGLNVSNVGAQDSAGNGSGDIVATYVGEIPLYIDLGLEDMQRVEVLLGPQGTLYGSGTMGGVIRYIPNRPQLDATALTLRGSGYSLSQSDEWGKQGGFTVNLPFGDIFAFRASLDYTDDPGFIDQPFLVKQAGLSDPEPNFASPSAVAANLFRKNDTNSTETMSGGK